MSSLLCRLLRVPREPGMPPGSHESVQVFRAARAYYRLLLLRWGIKQASAVVGIVVSLTILRQISLGWPGPVQFWLGAAEWIGVATFVAQLPFTFLMVKLDFEMRWYLVTDRSLRIRSGLMHVREMTMTFANIQQVTLQQGPLQRLFGLYDLQVRTAGGGSAGGDGQAHAQNATATHVGHFHGVDNAPAIRDLIMARMKQARDAGLGDPDDNRPTSETENPGAQIQWQHFRSAVAEVRAESKRIRQMVVSAGGWREGEAPPNSETGPESA